MSDRCFFVCVGVFGEVVFFGELGECLVRGGGLLELVLNEIWVFFFFLGGLVVVGVNGWETGF